MGSQKQTAPLIRRPTFVEIYVACFALIVIVMRSSIFR